MEFGDTDINIILGKLVPINYIISSFVGKLVGMPFWTL